MDPTQFQAAVNAAVEKAKAGNLPWSLAAAKRLLPLAPDPNAREAVQGLITQLEGFNADGGAPRGAPPPGAGAGGPEEAACMAIH